MQKRWHHMEVIICQWYSAYKNQIRNKTSSHITPYSMNGRVQTVCQTCASGNQHKARNAHGKSKKQPLWRDSEIEKILDRNWQKGRTRPNPDPKLKAAVYTQTEQLKQIAREAKEAKRKSFCEELSAETTLTLLAILPTNGREWSYQNNPRLRRHKQGKAKDQRRERSSCTWAIHRTEQPKQLRGKEACTEWSQQICRTRAQSGPDNELTEEEFNETLGRSGKDTAPGPDRFDIRTSRT